MHHEDQTEEEDYEYLRGELAGLLGPSGLSRLGCGGEWVGLQGTSGGAESGTVELSVRPFTLLLVGCY